MRIALTGATGLLGRNLLFEILKQNLDKLDNLEILVLGRPQNELPLTERLDNIIVNDGFDYIDVAPENRSALKKKIDRSIVPISFDLVHDGLGISQDEYSTLKREKIDHFFHVAALTDFRSSPAVKSALEEVNERGTRRVLDLIKNLNIGQLIYIGSAYSCGSKTGMIEPDYINLDETFRNPYEKSKLVAEISVREFAEEHKIRHKVFRPTTICGRLIEKPIGSINKFDVFYAWAAFFLKEKSRLIKSTQRLFDDSAKFDIRIEVNSNAGLNIVPVDYAAKMLYEVCVNDGESVSYHLANSGETNHQEYIKWMFECINVEGFSFTDKEPENKNGIEKVYYRTVGRIFTPYIIGDPMHFKVDNLIEFHGKTNVKCPVIGKENFMHLMGFAKQKNFGLNP